MKNLILAAIAALSLASAIVPLAHAADFGSSRFTHQRPYDNTGNGPDETGMEGGGG